MNLLQTEISRLGLNETETLNRLQYAGLISDNAVLARDVADSDTQAAMKSGAFDRAIFQL